MQTPIIPEIRNRSANDAKGGASTTMIRAEVKADDQIRANAKPINKARKSIVYLLTAHRKRAAQSGDPIDILIWHKAQKRI